MKIAIVIGVIVLIVGGIALAIYLGGGGGDVFSTQRIVIQGKQIEVFASQTELKQTFSLTVPAPKQTMDGETLVPEKPLTFVNPGGCVCFTLDEETKLPTGLMDCGTGVQAPTGRLFSAYCPTPNTDFYLQR